MIKKMMLLAVAAAAVIAFAVPAAASASWTHEGSPLSSDAVTSFTGLASFSVGGGAAGASANIHVELEMTAGTTTGHVIKFEDTDCTGFGQLAGLTCTGTAEGLPWDAEIDATGAVRINDILLINHYYSPQDAGHTTPLTTTELTGDVIATPDNPNAIGSVTLSDSGTHAGGLPAIVGGTLASSDPGTYGTE